MFQIEQGLMVWDFAVLPQTVIYNLRIEVERCLGG